MSVDQNGDEATSLAENQLPKPPAEQDDSTHTENESQSSGTLNAEDDDCNDTAKDEKSASTNVGPTDVPTTVEELLGGMLAWLTGLTIWDRAAAMGFSDGAFLSAFISMVPFKQPATSADAANEDGSFDWDSQVLVKDLERSYIGAMERSSSNDEPGICSANPESDVDASSAKAVDPLDRCSVADVFRIRRTIDSSALSLLANICLVLPSAVHHASGMPSGTRSPFVTVNPDFLEKLGAEELLAILFPKETCDESSLIPSFLGIAEAPSDRRWLDLFVKRHSDVESTTPAYLVLDRLRYQLLYSYSASRSSVDTQELATKEGSTNQLDSTPSGSEHEQTESYASSFAWMAGARSNVVALRELTASMDTANVADCLEPLLGLTSVKILTPEEVVFTPLRFAASAIRASSLSRLDCAASKSLMKLMSHPVRSSDCTPEKDEPPNDASLAFPGPSAASVKPCLTSHSSEGVSVLSQQPVSVTAETSGASEDVVSRKKKKKAKKRKVRLTAHWKSNKFFDLTVSFQNRKGLVAGAVEEPSEDLNIEPLRQLLDEVSVVRSTEAPHVDPDHVTDERSISSDQESVNVAVSADSDDTDVSTKTQPHGQPATQTDSIIISRGSGVVVVAAAPTLAAQARDPQAKTTEETLNDASDDVDDDVWETVEVRARGTRKKTPAASIRNGHFSSGTQPSSVGSQSDYGQSAKKNKALRSPITRKKNAARRAVREVVFSLLDSVDDEAARRQDLKQGMLTKQLPNPPGTARSVDAMNPWNRGPPTIGGASKPTFVEVTQGESKPDRAIKQGVTLRDVVLGRHTDISAAAIPSVQRTLTLGGHLDKKPTTFAQAVSSNGKVFSSRAKVNATAGADQNTAPTYQETASSHSNNQTAVKSCPTSAEERASKSDCSSTGTEDATESAPLASVNGTKPFVPAPPLPTMLSAENPNSANSSVASSLEVPHSSRRHHHHHHHHNSTSDVNDVGYHLLDVCDRLSQDMNLFMSRRSLALNARRRERGALLSALQSTIASLWPNRGHVEMYGSCATQLDLPSSDLDVVVIGLDRVQPAAADRKASRPTRSTVDSIQQQSSVDGSTDSLESTSEEPSSVDDSPVRHTVPPGAYPSMHLPKNAERVLRLAAALESQSWAVQIKSIPTASVPVIKILADPSKLIGTASVSEWLNSQEHFACQAAAAAGSATSEASPQLDLPHFQPLWRGADVMNGLLKLDITFEGPEHGGIGSTQFSTHVVAEACHESGLNPDATPLVQVIMVLKEILAQRKLNEPYSGGLSSYALLLLVVALLQERTVIREEIERSERQRQAMASGDNTASFSQDPAAPLVSASNDVTRGEAASLKRGASWADYAKTSASRDILAKSSSNTDVRSTYVRSKITNGENKSVQPSSKPTHRNPSVSPSPSGVSSWATIAKVNPASRASNPSTPKPLSNELQLPGLRDKPSFSEAVSGGMSKAATLPKRLQHPATLPAAQTSTSNAKGETNTSVASQPASTDKPSAAEPTPSPSFTIDASIGAPTFFPQGYNDVIEVLCSGETTAGKLLMHFLLYYGQHFDAQTTAIDISGKHERDFGGQLAQYTYYSPFIPRRSAGVIDPVTGMLTVEPIVIYDPLEGAENNNVARRCYAWSGVRWVFAQSYATLSSAVERSATPPTTPGGAGKATVAMESERSDFIVSEQAMGDLMDPSSPLLRCLLSF